MTADEKSLEIGNRIREYQDARETAVLLRDKAHRWAEDLSDAGRYLEGLAQGTAVAKTRGVEAIRDKDFQQLVSDLEVVNARLIQLGAILDVLGVRPK